MGACPYFLSRKRAPFRALALCHVSQRRPSDPISGAEIRRVDCRALSKEFHRLRASLSVHLVLSLILCSATSSATMIEVGQRLENRG
jgi:hypothetical protein